MSQNLSAVASTESSKPTPKRKLHNKTLVRKPEEHRLTQALNASQPGS